jgi:hypothetical protein
MYLRIIYIVKLRFISDFINIQKSKCKNKGQFWN